MRLIFYRVSFLCSIQLDRTHVFFLFVGWFDLAETLSHCFVEPAPLKTSIFLALSLMAFFRTDMACHPDGTTHIFS
uniref:Putative secreted protein n=1 Tax=Anopheles marajoara TaxID=58244 RepID=A0A2M4CCV7_9DIPT